jgi:F-type H+-transporting ATPase subunit delta
MREDTIARIYADALMQAADEKGERKAVLEELDSIAQLLDSEENFQLFLESPQIDKSEKKNVVDRLFRDKLGATTLNFLNILFNKNRQYLLRRIVRQYKDLDEEREGIRAVTITSARPVSPELEETYREALEKALQAKVRLAIEIVPSLLGGIIIRYEDKVLDGSIRRKLEDLRDRMSAIRLMEGTLYED